MTHIAPDTRANARRLRAETTPQERKLWIKLRDINHMIGTNFRRQAPIGRYIADFADYGRRMVVEVDGGGHGGPRDTARDAWLTTQGFVVLRFWNNEVDGNIEGVMQMVLDAIDAAPTGGTSPPPPSPPHRGEGGRAISNVGASVNHCSPSPPPCGKGLGERGTKPDAQEGTSP